MPAATQLSALIVPQIFTPYVLKETEIKSKLIQSGAISRSPFLDNFLTGGGNVVTMPFWRDLARTGSNVSSDNDDTLSTARPFTAAAITQHRLSRNVSYTSTDLAGDIVGDDPLRRVVSRVSDFWAWDIQNNVVSTLRGLFADNAAAPTGSEHVANDMTVDIKGSSYTAGVTSFGQDAFVDALMTMGDSYNNLGVIWCHSVVHARMIKEDSYALMPDSEGKLTIPTYMGKIVIVDDMLPRPATGVFETWILGQGALELGLGSPKNPTEVWRNPAAGNGGGTEILYSRMESVIAPAGTSYVGTATVGGATNATLEAAASWLRVYPERKQIPIARLITREF